ncbi:hypothetical protein [Pseudoalteromonas phage C7]|uniref:hypothetical protein n=1 Tax=Pseudoalteromonas phage C7 TaxID=2510494 RepID=UPI00101889E7|nr:hypothetical protein PP587_gp57 [Pseudoalteromonas phage C7]QAY18011.1 hypothetical protein [Pseudoalteromonas phage C7]
MSRKGKKYNPVEAAKRAARVGLKNLAVWHSHNTESDYTAELVNVKSYKTIPVGESTVFAITKIKHKWQVLLLAIGEDGSGKKYFKVDPVQIINEMYQSDLAEYLDARHKDFVAKSFNKNHLTNVAWLAVPNGFEADKLTDRQIDELITAKGAW